MYLMDCNNIRYWVYCVLGIDVTSRATAYGSENLTPPYMAVDSEW